MDRKKNILFYEIGENNICVYNMIGRLNAKRWKNNEKSKNGCRV